MKSTYTVLYRRKRQGKTDYTVRLRLLASRQPRIVVRKSNKHVLLQVIKYEPTGDKVMASAHTGELTKYGWHGSTSSTPAAYLAGLLLGKKAKKANISAGIADIGLQTSVKGGVVYAALKGVRDAGITVPSSDSVVPDDKRIKGMHIATWAASVAKDPKKYPHAFSKYKNAKGVSPEQIPQLVEQVKRKVLEAA